MIYVVPLDWSSSAFSTFPVQCISSLPEYIFALILPIFPVAVTFPEPNLNSAFFALKLFSATLPLLHSTFNVSAVTVFSPPRPETSALPEPMSIFISPVIAVTLTFPLKSRTSVVSVYGMSPLTELAPEYIRRPLSLSVSLYLSGSDISIRVSTSPNISMEKSNGSRLSYI